MEPKKVCLCEVKAGFHVDLVILVLQRLGNWCLGTKSKPVFVLCMEWGRLIRAIKKNSTYESMMFFKGEVEILNRA